ncbi:CTP pyrophosphohydrolase [uncultured Clostridium sp.]|nr:CTP pyrophosphohydrolase [uncultured Clostridium sp.]
MDTTEVVAALIKEQDRFLICQRPAGKSLALFWEFVGGKVEQGETKEQALVRECQEELGVIVAVGDVFWEVTYHYPDAIVHLTLFEANIKEGTPQKLEHQDIRWIKKEEIPHYDFCPANKDVLDRLQNLPVQETTYRGF